MPTVTKDILFKGAWYAIEQCGLLLQHAVMLHDAKAYSTAVAVALFAREELGRYKILLDFWEKADGKRKNPTVDEIKKACDAHEEKQRRAQLSLMYRAEGPGKLSDLLRARIENRPGSPAYIQAEEEIKKLDETTIKRTPKQRHLSRMKALYVDLNDTGTSWNRPCELFARQSEDCLTHAANDYAVQQGNLQSGMVNPNLGAALEAWPERPELPRPVWPDTLGK
jgi:AbiV family abortive infection protein